MTDDKENHIQQALDEILILERAAASIQIMWGQDVKVILRK